MELLTLSTESLSPVDPYDTPYVFENKPAAKSSSSVMQATVCQKCGHKFDGKIGGNGDPCDCRCHDGRV
jgi:hypothetical protein